MKFSRRSLDRILEQREDLFALLERDPKISPALRRLLENLHSVQMVVIDQVSNGEPQSVQEWLRSTRISPGLLVLLGLVGWALATGAISLSELIGIFTRP